MGSRPSLRMGSWSSPLVKPHCLAVIILEEAASVWRFFHLREAALATATHRRKSRQGFPRRPVPLRCVCLEVCRAERCSNVARPASHRTQSLHLNEAFRCVAGVSGPTYPRCEECCHRRRCRSSQRYCPNDASGFLSPGANLAGWLRVTAAATSSPGGVEHPLTQKPW